ncbi:MAG: SDR family NAD(P)-dependent oxidoreductase [Elusimicrobia bacterium]|nr:SDR family NAD(P)-dependent oxidoreductase [Elusimicrobiota bacterium]MBD3411501.1 SDR family NAD(P)-dependent oxidoreductase [Elusimicrobiota bacterium]
MNKVVFVSGSSRGIGKSIASGFARNGWQVGINGATGTDRLKATYDEINNSKDCVISLPGDVSNKEQVEQIYEKLIKSWGRIDCLVLNAGVIHECFLGKLTDTEWNRNIAVNLSGVFLCLKTFSRAFIKQRFGSIIIIGSIQGVRGGYGTAAYAASKGGVISLMLSAAAELGRRNITVNVVFPGYHATGMENKAYEQKALQESVISQTTDINELVQFVTMLAEMKTVSGQVFNWDSRMIRVL